MSRKQLHQRIWNRLHEIMDAIAQRDGKSDWRQQLAEISVDDRRKRRENGDSFDDSEVLEALLLAILSGNTDWSKIQRARPQLPNAVLNFNPEAFADLNSTKEVHARLSALGVNSISLGARLRDLQKTTRVLIRHSRRHGSMDGYIAFEFGRVAREPERLALTLGLPGAAKLEGFGVATAAEALRNLGYNLAKPDRHILRAVGSWGLVDFPGWDGDKTRYPSANPAKLLEAMRAIRAFAEDIEESVSLTDTTIWYACSRGGGNLTNKQLRQLAA
jgi:endonuclease III